MVHNGIEYGMMGAIAEGLSILKHANVGEARSPSTPRPRRCATPQYYPYDFDLAAVAEVWRHGSVISSWLVDLTADALARSPDLAEYGGRVSDSGEGRWTVEAAINESVPAPVISAALWQRYESRGAGEFTAKVLSAMRAGFGGHEEKPLVQHELRVFDDATGLAAAGGRLRRRALATRARAPRGCLHDRRQRRQEPVAHAQ